MSILTPPGTYRIWRYSPFSARHLEDENRRIIATIHRPVLILILWLALLPITYGLILWISLSGLVTLPESLIVPVFIFAALGPILIFYNFAPRRNITVVGKETGKVLFVILQRSWSRA